MLAYYLSHPDVTIDPKVPVKDWGLSARGRQRAEALAERHVLPFRAPLFASSERKALDLAEILARANGGLVRSDGQFDENDRSATGFLPGEQFEAMADRFFAEPDESAAGWERAVDAQARVVAAVSEALERVREPALFCGHGGVGTLLKCWVGQRAIARSEDQGRIGAPSGGNVFVFNLTERRLISDWTPFEAFAG